MFQYTISKIECLLCGTIVIPKFKNIDGNEQCECGNVSIFYINGKVFERIHDSDMIKIENIVIEDE